ncbi:MAG: methyltransferase domain-containing protein [Candidatus Methanoperedens sp.]|nr:methyltransferase domain-containing protein [Candidatus Methanoperedens sp.]
MDISDMECNLVFINKKICNTAVTALRSCEGNTFHALNEPDRVLEELHRVLKRDGVLSFSDHRMREREIMAGVTKGGGCSGWWGRRRMVLGKCAEILVADVLMVSSCSRITKLYVPYRL